jgi:hypothetical protein
MKAKRRVVVLAGLAVLIPTVWAAVRAADKAGADVPQLPYVAEQRDTLRGLQGMGVFVQPLGPEVERLGLTREALQTDTELQLRQYGIKVLSFREALLTPGAPFLHVLVDVGRVNDETLSFVAVSTHVRFYEIVSLEREPATRCPAATWEAGNVARITSTKRLAEIRDSVKDRVADFINDYLAANPKEGKVKEESRTKEEAADSKP